MPGSDVDDVERTVAAEGRAIRRNVRKTLISGLALTLPFFITVIVLLWVLELVSNALTPLSDALIAMGLVGGMSRVLVEGLAVLVIVGIVFTVGVASRHGPDTDLATHVDVLMEDIPGLGSIYTSVERMSDVLLEGDTQSFQEVKLVEFPREGSFALAFLTAEAPRAITDPAGHADMVTVFVPLAPNPVMGGHLLSLPRERVYDVDLTVEEGTEAIMTTGMAIDDRVHERGSG